MIPQFDIPGLCKVTREPVGSIPSDLWPRPLPIMVVPFGLLIDAILHAIVWFAILFGFGIMRRVYRIRRGQCPSRGYDLRGQLSHHSERGSTTIICPESGSHLSEDEQSAASKRIEP